GGGGRRRQRGLSRQAGGGVPIDEDAVAGGQGRQGRAIDLGLAIRRDGQRRGGDGEAPGEVRNRVIGIHRTAGRDAGGAGGDMAGGGGGRRQGGPGGQVGRAVAVDPARVRRGQARQRRAVDLALVVRRDGQRRRGDRQRASHVGDRVIRIDRATSRDRV